MNILYISYWEINSILTTSSVFPTISVLDNNKSVSKIFLASIERKEMHVFNNEFKKVEHIAIEEPKSAFHIFNKISAISKATNQLLEFLQKNKIDLIIARCSPAGILALKLHNKTAIPFIVESFEPHSSYMLESGVWSWYDPRYIFQKKWEEHQKRKALKIITVTDNYKQQLINEGIDKNKIAVIPCTVDTELFKFSEIHRSEIRSNLQIKDNQTVGIYVGKFGDIYYDTEAFEIFKLTETIVDNFHLIILSTDDKNIIKQKLVNVKFPLYKVTITKVNHNDVPKFLSASDFAFSLIKPAPSKQYCSPIKNAEYWANGLPILLTENIGDDSNDIKNNNLGNTFNLNKNNINLKIKDIHQTAIKKNRIIRFNFAKNFRSRDIIFNFYSIFLKEFDLESNKNEINI